MRRISLMTWIAVCIVASLAATVPWAGPAAGPRDDHPPQAWLSRVQNEIRDSEYRLTLQSEPILADLGSAWHAPNRAHNFRTYFTEEGIHLIERRSVESGWSWTLALEAIGRGDRAIPVSEPELLPAENRIQYAREMITEWYVNDERGLEQGFDLAAPPEQFGLSGNGSGTEASAAPLFLQLSLRSSLVPSADANGQFIDFSTADGRAVLRYADLVVTDARGRRLPSSMRLHRENGKSSIRLLLDDRSAVYPLVVDPLASSPAWMVDGGQATSNFGQSVASAGDVNADGYTDVIIGAPFFDNGSPDEGVAFGYYGSTSGLPVAADWQVDINQGGANFGFSVAGAGDVNGDGYADVIVGANMSSGSQDDEGRVWAYHGSASGLESNFSWTVDSDQDFAQLGHSVASAGDVNDDGYADVIIAAPYFDVDTSNEGRVWVHHGSALGLSNTPSWTGSGDETDGAYGYSVAWAGDVNGDGISDVIIGEPYADHTNSDQGRALVYHGSASGLPSDPDTELYVAQNSARCGWSVATAGDVTGDGYSDVLMGCPLYDFSGDADAGGALLFEGSASGTSSTESWFATGSDAGFKFGSSVSSAGDANGDGYADVVIGAPSYANGEVLEGAAFFYESSLLGLSTTHSWSAECDQALCSFGGSVATAGDVDGDGYSDVIVGAARYDGREGLDEGRAYLYRGSVGGVDDFSSWSTQSDQADAELGYSVASAGDTNGDGFSDVIVGVPLYDNGFTDEGRILVYLGSGAGLETSAEVTIDGGKAEGRVGWSVAGLGDVNADGYDDVAVGCPEFSSPELAEGVVFVLFGSQFGPDTTPTWFADSDQEDANFGFSVAGAGDVNGDGKTDLIVGAPGFRQTEADEGRVYIYLDIEPGLAPEADWIMDGGQGGAEYGYCVASAGDVDGDGLSEVIIGEPFRDNGVSNEGRVYAHRGSVFGPITEPFWMLNGPQEAGSFGVSVGTAGDVDGDGYAEVLVGAPLLENGEAAEGGVFLYEGSSSGLSTLPTWSLESNQVDAEMGRSVRCAGDVNGDGYADVIIGTPLYNNGETDEGMAQLFTGSATGLGTTPAWIAESNVAGARFGESAGAAGDINADGYGDLIVGAPGSSNGENAEGQAFLYYGNGLGGFMVMQQRQADDLTALGLLGVSTETDEFRLAAFGRTPFGMGQVGLEWEVKPIGTPFDANSTGSSAGWVSTNLPVVPPTSVLNDAVEGLTPGRAYHWRARTLYNPAIFPLQQASRWINIPTGGWNENDLRVWAEIDLGVSQADSKDPVFVAESFDYTIDVTNSGPDGIDATLQDTLPDGVAFVSATPSQGDCVLADHVLTCFIGWVPSGGAESVEVTVLPQQSGSQTNVLSVASPAATDSAASNDSSIINTTVNAAMLGNFVWEDLDGDGIQDPGEPGMANVLVAAYDTSDELMGTVVTNGAGNYSMPGLVYAGDYYLRFFPPPGYVLTLAGQGSDDLLDSDPDPFTLETGVINLVEQPDLVRWDAGMIPNCVAPDEPVYINSMSLTDDGNEYPILNFLDPNQPSQITGYNVYRASDPAPPPATWPLIATDVVDMDEATPNNQWFDTTGDVSPSGTWYYKVSGYNHRCPAEGPL